VIEGTAAYNKSYKSWQPFIFDYFGAATPYGWTLAVIGSGHF
jgi:hypothetical protein